MPTLQQLTGARCETCALWVVTPIRGQDRSFLGQCRAGAPTALAIGERVVTRWPLTRPDEWCAEHATPA